MAIKDKCLWHEDRIAVGYCAFCGAPVADSIGGISIAVHYYGLARNHWVKI